MAPKTLSFKCALITGGGGGIGKAMAETLISMGKKVIIAGRTEVRYHSISLISLQNPTVSLSLVYPEEGSGRAWPQHNLLRP